MGKLLVLSDELLLGLRVLGVSGNLARYGMLSFKEGCRGELGSCHLKRITAGGVSVVYSVSASALVQVSGGEERLYVPVDWLLGFLEHGGHGAIVRVVPYYGGVKVCGDSGELACDCRGVRGVSCGGYSSEPRELLEWYVEFRVDEFLSNLRAVLSYRSVDEEPVYSDWGSAVEMDFVVRRHVDEGVERVFGELGLLCTNGRSVATVVTRGECYGVGGANNELGGVPKKVKTFVSREGMLGLMGVLEIMGRVLGDGGVVRMGIAPESGGACVVFKCGGATVSLDQLHSPDFPSWWHKADNEEAGRAVRVNAGVLRGLVCAIVPGWIKDGETYLVNVGLLNRHPGGSPTLLFRDVRFGCCNERIEVEMEASVTDEVSEGFRIRQLDLVPMRGFLSNIDCRQTLMVYLQAVKEDEDEDEVALVLRGDGVKYMGLAEKGWIL